MELTIENELLEGTSKAEVLRELSIGLYQQQKISLLSAIRLAGLSKTEFHFLLRERGISMDYGYGVEDYEDDLKTLDRLFPAHDNH